MLNYVEIVRIWLLLREKPSATCHFQRCEISNFEWMHVNLPMSNRLIA